MANDRDDINENEKIDNNEIGGLHETFKGKMNNYLVAVFKKGAKENTKKTLNVWMLNETELRKQFWWVDEPDQDPVYIGNIKLTVDAILQELKYEKMIRFESEFNGFLIKVI